MYKKECKNEKILPIELNAAITTECWNYYKLVIIQTLPEYEKWLSSHLDLYTIIAQSDLFFGANGVPHKADYFSDFLEIEEQNIYEIPSSKVVSWVKERIDLNWYCTVFVGADWETMHEVFIYGYEDDGENFYSISLDERGHFQAQIITYEWVQSEYKKMLRFHQANPELYFAKNAYNYLASCLRPCYTYLSKNYASDYLKKIAHETYGTRTEQYFSRRDGSYTETPQIYYTGVTCMLSLKTAFEALNNRDEDAKNTPKKSWPLFRISLFKLLEHQTMLSNAML